MNLYNEFHLSYWHKWSRTSTNPFVFLVFLMGLEHIDPNRVVEIIPCIHLDWHGAGLLTRRGGVAPIGGHRPAPLQAERLVPPFALAAVPLLLLPVLHLHQSCDERVLHLLLKLQLLPPGQLVDQLLWVLPDGGLHPVQQLDQRWAGHAAEACRTGNEGKRRDGESLPGEKQQHDHNQTLRATQKMLKLLKETVLNLLREVIICIK